MSTPELQLNLLESGHGVRFSETANEKISFAENIARQRTSLRLTHAQAANLVQVSARTWRRWESGKITPPIRTQAAVFRLLDSAGPNPTDRRRRTLQRSHHLYWERHKGWFLRLTIDRGPKVVGTRVKVRLYTKDEDEAIGRRVVVMAAFRRLGLKFKARIQKAKSTSALK